MTRQVLLKISHHYLYFALRTVLDPVETLHYMSLQQDIHVAIRLSFSRNLHCNTLIIFNFLGLSREGKQEK